jgi:hypothetical protein
VTRFGDFSPIERLFTFDNCLLKITEVAQILEQFFPKVKVEFNFDKTNAMGYIFGDFFLKPIQSPCLNHRFAESAEGGCRFPFPCQREASFKQSRFMFGIHRNLETVDPHEHPYLAWKS